MFAEMKSNRLFSEGVWLDWGFIREEKDRIKGGDSVKFYLTSATPPGIVDCKVIGGEWGTKGVGEGIPGLLAEQIPIFEDLASGFTIGPDERLLKFSDSEKIRYLLENLSIFQEAGWMSEGTAEL